MMGGWIWDKTHGAWIVREVAAFGLRWLVVGALAMLGALLFGRGYKKRIAALEAKPSESTQVILQPGATYNDFRGASGEWHLKADGQVEVISARRILVQTLGITAPAMEAIATVNKRTLRADESDDR